MVPVQEKKLYTIALKQSAKSHSHYQQIDLDTIKVSADKSKQSFSVLLPLHNMLLLFLAETYSNTSKCKLSLKRT